MDARSALLCGMLIGLSSPLALVGTGCGDDDDSTFADGGKVQEEFKKDASASDAAPRFAVRFEGDVIILDVESARRLSQDECANPIRFEQLEGDEFVPMRDDRRLAPAYYLDDHFVSEPSKLIRCDVPSCAQFPRSHSFAIGSANEYVKIGTRPYAASDKSKVDVDVIESRPVSGRIRIRIDYFDDERCDAPSGTTLELTIPTPEQGLCCPIGEDGCSSDGPGGGWAPSAEACPPWSVGRDDIFAVAVVEDDPRGCPRLVLDKQMCCGCGPDADAGM
jgi:hypothetical protein